jgi:RNA polymerase sigma-70 factor (ECF subfamily)
MTNPDDHEIVAKAQAGDIEAVGTLYERHSDWVYRYALRRVGDPEVARDLLQDTFLKALESLPRFKLGHNFGAWLNGITKHVVADYLRRYYRWKEKLPDLVEKFVGYDSTITYCYIDEAIDAKQAVDQILTELNPNHQAVIKMRVMEGMSRGEVALSLYGEDTEENRRKVTIALYKAMQAAKKVGERIRGSTPTQIRDPFSDSHKR